MDLETNSELAAAVHPERKGNGADKSAAAEGETKDDGYDVNATAKDLDDITSATVADTEDLEAIHAAKDREPTASGGDVQPLHTETLEEATVDENADEIPEMEEESRVSTVVENEDIKGKVRFTLPQESKEPEKFDDDLSLKKEAARTAPTMTDVGHRVPSEALKEGEAESKEEIVWFSHTSLLITSVFSVVCFFPMGLVALYYGIKVRRSYKSRLETAKVREYARRSTFCSIAAIITGIIALLLILMVLILGITGVVQ